MAARRRFPIPYDYFKLIVTLFIILLILLAWRSSGPAPTMDVAVAPSGAVTFSGSAAPGANVSIVMQGPGGNTSKLKALADDSGSWLASKRLLPGSYQARATIGGRSSQPYAFEVPRSAGLEQISLNLGKNGLLNGKAQAGETLLVLLDGQAVAKVPVAADGSWSYRLNAAPGAHTLQLAYASSPQITSEPLAVNVASATPKREAATVTGAKFVDGKAALSGHAPAGSRQVFVWADGVLLGIAAPDASGDWSLTAHLGPGKHQIWVSLSEDGSQAGPKYELETPAAPENIGRAYVVKEGDWLTKLARDFLGSEDRYREIREATNAKAAHDPSFAIIKDDNLIYPGEKIWIPAR